MHNKYASLKQIKEYDENIDNDTTLPQSIKDNVLFREVCRAGLYLAYELTKLNCPQDLIVRIQHAAGGLSFGRDVWETHYNILQSYVNNELDFDDDPGSLN